MTEIKLYPHQEKVLEQLRNMPPFGVVLSVPRRMGMTFVAKPLIVLPKQDTHRKEQEEGRLLRLKKRPIGEFIYNLSNKSLL